MGKYRYWDPTLGVNPMTLLLLFNYLLIGTLLQTRLQRGEVCINPSPKWAFLGIPALSAIHTIHTIHIWCKPSSLKICCASGTYVETASTSVFNAKWEHRHKKTENDSFNATFSLYGSFRIYWSDIYCTFSQLCATGSIIQSNHNNISFYIWLRLMDIVNNKMLVNKGISHDYINDIIVNMIIAIFYAGII